MLTNAPGKEMAGELPPAKRLTAHVGTHSWGLGQSACPSPLQTPVGSPLDEAQRHKKWWHCHSHHSGCRQQQLSCMKHLLWTEGYTL